MRRIALLVIAGLAFTAPAVAGKSPTASASAPSTTNLKRELRKYKQRSALHRRQRDRYEMQRDDARNNLFNTRAELANANGGLTIVRGQLATVSGERDEANRRSTSLESENAGLRGTVPDQVAAIARRDNIAELFNLVINPAFTNWPCGGSRFFGETFYSVDFDRRTSYGDCY